MSIRLSALTCGDAVALGLLAPQLPGAARAVTHPRASLAAHGADGALLPVLCAVLCLVLAWLGAGLLAAWLAPVPGAVGQVAGRVARVALPAAVRRTIAGSLGLGVLLAPVAAGAQAAAPHPNADPGRAVVSSAAAVVGSTAGTAPSPGPRWPTSPAGSRHAPAGAVRPAAGRVTVRAGDCLWLIAQRRLGRDATDPDVAAYARRLHLVNRAVIGADPGHIEPGQVLLLPTRLPTPTPEDSR